MVEHGNTVASVHFRTQAKLSRLQKLHFAQCNRPPAPSERASLLSPDLGQLLFQPNILFLKRVDCPLQAQHVGRFASARQHGRRRDLFVFNHERALQRAKEPRRRWFQCDRHHGQPTNSGLTSGLRRVMEGLSARQSAGRALRSSGDQKLRSRPPNWRYGSNQG
jgi:hypothetical protein